MRSGVQGSGFVRHALAPYVGYFIFFGDGELASFDDTTHVNMLRHRSRGKNLFDHACHELFGSHVVRAPEIGVAFHEQVGVSVLEALVKLPISQTAVSPAPGRMAMSVGLFGPVLSLEGLSCPLAGGLDRTTVPARMDRR